MSGDQHGLTISLSSFLTPTTGSISSRESELQTPAYPAGSSENAWDELVDWFEQQHEWVILVSSFENWHS